MGNEKKVKRGILFLLVIAITLFVYVLSSGTFAWLADDSSILSEGKSASISTFGSTANKSIWLIIKEDSYGIPGETVIVTEKNLLTPPKFKGDCSFQVTYSISEESQEIIKNISLTKESADKASLIELNSSDENALEASYFGRIDESQVLNLGDLEVTYSQNSYETMGIPISINASVSFCQLNEEAMKDFYNLSDNDIKQFNHWFDN